MNTTIQIKIVEGWRSEWSYDRIREAVGDNTLTDEEISNQIDTLAPKWNKFVYLCKIMRTEPTYEHFELTLKHK